jgi:hypothetical protein
VAKNKPNVLDELVELGRRILDKLDDLIIPESFKPRKPARVPVPVRNNPRSPHKPD